MNLLEENGMGILFANAEKMDIQEERRLRLEAQRRAEKEHQMRMASESKAEKELQMRIASESKAEKELQMRIASESKLREAEKKIQELERLLWENSTEPKITEK